MAELQAIGVVVFLMLVAFGILYVGINQKMENSQPPADEPEDHGLHFRR